MFRQLRHRQTKGAANSRVGANITAPHLDSTPTMHEISPSDLDAMSLEQLVARMDEFILESHRERYGPRRETFSIALPSEAVQTVTVRSLPEPQARRVAQLCFAYLVQLELEGMPSGFANALLYTPTYTAADWQSPVFRLREAAIRQYQIIAGRVAFEIFMDLLYTLETGERLKSKRSKLKAFRKWLCEPNDRFHYFAHVLLAAYRFDRDLRSPEIHGASRYPRRLLLLNVPSIEESNEPFGLVNALTGSWQPLIDLLNNIRPNYMSISKQDEEWFHIYMKGTKDEIEKKLKEILEVIVRDSNADVAYIRAHAGLA